ncbi:uncharacterized protein LOC144493183 [Mustelus asterias]
MQLGEASLRECLRIPELEAWLLDYSCRHRLEPVARGCLEQQDIDISDLGVLPLRLTAAAVWNSVKKHQTENYERVVDFVNVIWQQATGLVTYRHYLKVCIAFKAKLLMEMFVKRQSLLDILQTLEKYFPKVIVDDPRVSRRDAHKERQCRLQFRKLVLLLIRDEQYREEFLQERLEEEYGSLFMASTLRLLWEFLERLESILPQPRIDQLLAADVNVRCLSPAEQSLLSILVNPHTNIPDLLLTVTQRVREQRNQDLGDHSRSERHSGIPQISSSMQTALSEGHRTGTERISLMLHKNGCDPSHGNVKGRAEWRKELSEQWVGVPLPEGGPEAQEREQQSQISTGAGVKVNSLRNEVLAAADTGEIDSPLTRGQNLVFFALQFDQSCDEDVEKQQMLKFSPPNPLQSQVDLDSSNAVPAQSSFQPQSPEPPSQPVTPSGLDSNTHLSTSKRHRGTVPAGQAHPGCLSHSPTRSRGPGIDLELLAAAPLSLHVQETLSRSPLFQPKVSLLRLAAGPSARAVPAEWGLQRNDSSGDGVELGAAVNSPEQNPHTFPWNLRKRPQQSSTDQTIEQNTAFSTVISPKLNYHRNWFISPGTSTYKQSSNRTGRKKKWNRGAHPCVHYIGGNFMFI